MVLLGITIIVVVVILANITEQASELEKLDDLRTISNVTTPKSSMASQEQMKANLQKHPIEIEDYELRGLVSRVLTAKLASSMDPKYSKDPNQISSRQISHFKMKELVF